MPDYPNKPITFVVPQAPGSVVDRIARVFTPAMSRMLGQEIKLENIPGAQSLVGCEHVFAHSPADGYTVLLTTPLNLSSFPATVRNLPFNPKKDITPVAVFAYSPLLFVVPLNQKWTTFKELIDDVKKSPGVYRSGSSSASNTLQTEIVVQANGLKVACVLFEATSAYQNALVSGEIQMGLITEYAARNEAAKLRYLAQTGRSRSAAFPQIPTFLELGMPQVRGVDYTLNVRSGTPRAAVEALHAAAARALQLDEVKEGLARLSVSPLDQGPDAAAESLQQQIDQAVDVAHKLGIVPA